MKTLRAYPLIFVAGFLTQSAHAAQILEFCSEKQIAQETSLANGKLDTDGRIHEMERLFHEIATVIDEARTGSAKIPTGFLSNCRTKKEASFEVHLRNASQSTSSKFRFNFVIGQYLDLTGHNKEAYDRFAAAADADPREYMAHVRALISWAKLRMTQFRNTGAAQMSQRELDQILADTNKHLSAIMNNLGATRERKLEAYSTRAYALEAFGRPAEAMADWRQVSALDPKNELALRKLASFEMDRGRKAESRRYLEQLSPLAPGDAKVQTSLLTLQVDMDDAASALRTAELALKALPKNAEIHALYAQALAASGRLEEANTEIRIAAKAAPDKLIVRQSLAFVYLIRGEQWMDQKLFGKALGEFERALKLNPNNQRLRNRMGRLLFTQRQSTNFEPQVASRKDMDRATELLEPLVKSNFVEQATVEAFIQAAVRSNYPAKASVGCERFNADFGSFPHSGLVMDCAKGLRAAGHADKARKVLEDALVDPRFQSGRREFAEALSGVK